MTEKKEGIYFKSVSKLIFIQVNGALVLLAIGSNHYLDIPESGAIVA